MLSPGLSGAEEYAAGSTEPLAAASARRLAAILAHNVNNSLTGVIGYLELALRATPSESPVHTHLEGGLECAYQAADAVRRIVNFTRRSGQRQATGRMALRDVAEEAVRHAARANPAARWALTVETDGWVEGNAPLVREALDQLLANAVEAMPPGGALRLRLWQSEAWCHVAVSDGGPGLAPEVLDHLFEPFVTTKASGHLGLGLVLSREMLEAQGGRLDLASDAGKGTTATLSLPTARRSLEAKEWQVEPPHGNRPPLLLRPAENVA
jgi:signal transduction histidine kinase